jgi:hypothetical protein
VAAGVPLPLQTCGRETAFYQLRGRRDGLRVLRRHGHRAPARDRGDLDKTLAGDRVQALGARAVVP